MRLWRISNHATLDGGGGLRTGGRWHSRGRRIVYTSGCASTALLEILVHLELDPRQLPLSYQLLAIDAPDELPVHRLRDLPSSWRDDEAVTRQLGDAWLSSGETAMLEVPSTIIDVERNFLINPDHPDAARVALVEASAKPFDPRLFR